MQALQTPALEGENWYGAVQPTFTLASTPWMPLWLAKGVAPGISPELQGGEARVGDSERPTFDLRLAEINGQIERTERLMGWFTFEVFPSFIPFALGLPLLLIGMNSSQLGTNTRRALTATGIGLVMPILASIAGVLLVQLRIAQLKLHGHAILAQLRQHAD